MSSNRSTEELNIQQEVTYIPKEKKVKILSRRQKIWIRFKKHKFGVVGGVVALAFILISLFAPFFSPYDYTKPAYEEAFMPPQKIHFIDENGNFSLRPHFYKMTMGFNEETWGREFVEDTSQKYPVRFFARGWDYKLWGVFKSNIHLFTVKNPGTMYLFGTDKLGRDLFSRIIFGSRVSFFVAIAGALIIGIVGSIVGGISGYFSGKVDLIVQRIIEIFQLFPTLPLMMALSAAIPATWHVMYRLVGIIVVMSIVQWTYLAREVRALVLSYREEDFVIAAKALGERDLIIVLKHVIPNCFSHIIVVMTLTIPGLIIAESSLSFLGLGIKTPMVSWGVLLQQASNLQTIGQYPWIMIPGFFIFLTVLSVNFFGDGIRDAIDPHSN